MQATNESTHHDGHNNDQDLRYIKIPRAAPKIDEYGFRLTRSKWDPYPWVCDVAMGTPASLCGLQSGDCILKVNGIDILGMPIAVIAKIVKSHKEYVTILCWNSGCEIECDESSICCEPMPISLQRLAIVVESILKAIECPVCNVSISPPVMQCQNGHLICLDCRIRSKNCPMCRGFFTPIRSTIAEEIYSIIAYVFKQYRSDRKLRHKVFGNITATKTKACDYHIAYQNGNSTYSPPFKQNLKKKIFSKFLQLQACSPENISQCYAARLLRVEPIDSFSIQQIEKMTLESFNEKAPVTRLTATALRNLTNELLPMPIELQKTAEELKFRVQTTKTEGGNLLQTDISNEQAAQQSKSRQKSVQCLSHLDELAPPISVTTLPTVNELLTDQPAKELSTSMTALLLFQCTCKCTQPYGKKHSHNQ